MIGGGSGYAANWGAIGAIVAAASTTEVPQDPKDAKIKELAERLRITQDKLDLADSKAVHREDALQKSNSLVDDQAAQIVDLHAKLTLARPTSPEALEMGARMRSMQKIESDLRMSLERAEARASQLLVHLQSLEIEIPQEPAYFRGTEWSG